MLHNTPYVKPVRHPVQISPAWNKRHHQPSKDFGVGCCYMKLDVSLEQTLALTLTIATGWYLPEVGFSGPGPTRGHSMTWHYAEKPLHTASIEGAEVCDVLGVERCWVSISFLASEPYGELLVREGLEVVWLKLEAELLAEAARMAGGAT